MYSICMQDRETWTTGSLVWHLALRWRAGVDRAIAHLGLTHAQYSVLASLHGLVSVGERPSQRELATHTGLQRIYISKLVRAWEKGGFVVSERDDRAGRAGPARRLNGRYNLPFYTHDERLTTFEAKGERRDRGGQKGSYRDNPVDAIAAALLLQGWLDENTALFES